MKRAKGTGTIFKLKGNRHRPYVAYVYGETVFNEEKKTCYRSRKAVGYFETQREAQQKLEEYLQSPYDLDETSVTFGDIWDKIYPKLDVSTSRMNALSSAYNKYLQGIKNVPINEIKTNRLQDIIDSMTVGSSTKVNVKGIMSLVFEYAMQNDIIKKDYSKYVSFKKDETEVERVLFTSEEVQTLFNYVDDWKFLLVVLLLYTGLRPIELLDLKKEDVYLEEDYFKVIDSKTSAGRRQVPIHPTIRKYFEELMEKEGAYLIQTKRGNKVRYDNFRSRYMPQINEVLGTEHTLYDARHTFVTRARECGMDDLCKKKIVGHKPQNVTEDVYTHIKIDELKQEIAKLYY